MGNGSVPAPEEGKSTERQRDSQVTSTAIGPRETRLREGGTEGRSHDDYDAHVLLAGLLARLTAQEREPIRCFQALSNKAAPPLAGVKRQREGRNQFQGGRDVI